MIWLRGVTKSYGPDKVVLDHVDLHIKRGEFAFVMGHSGAGKSTLLKLLFASERPTQGEVVVGGVNVGSITRRDMPFFRRKVAVIYQDFKLLPRRTVLENVAFALEVVGRPRREIHERSEKILEEVGLLHHMHKLPATLSGGEQQRVAIARALVRDPWLLLADEPTGNLDTYRSREIFAMFDRINERGTTIMIATHALDLVKRQSRSQRTLLIEKGKLIDTDKEDILSWTPMPVTAIGHEDSGSESR